MSDAADGLHGMTLFIRERWRPKVMPLLEPGEQLQVVIESSKHRAEGVRWLVMKFWPWFFSSRQFLLIATDRSWIVLKSAYWNHLGKLTLVYRGPRDVVIDYSWFRRFEKFDRPYSIDPIYGDSVNAANSALAAAQRGESWDLATARAELDAIRPDPAAAVFAEVALVATKALGPMYRKLPKRPRWVRRLNNDD